MNKLHLHVDSTKKKRKGQLWCPYCGEWTYFEMFRKMRFFRFQSTYRRCVKCGISEKDFWVKTVNKLFRLGVNSCRK